MSELAQLVVEAAGPGDGEPIGYDGWNLVVQIAVPILTAQQAQWGSGTWNTAKWSTGAGVWGLSTWGESQWSSGLEWLSISDRVRGAAWTRGRQGLAGRPEVGTATIDLENTDGYLSPWNTHSAFPSRRYLAPGSTVRIGYARLASDDNPRTWEPAFTGRIESIDESAVVLDADVQATFHLTETTSLLATIDRLEQSAQGGGEFSDERILRLLADAGWPYGTDIGGWFVPFHLATMQATTMAGNRLAEVYLTADSVLWDAFSGKDGRLKTWAKGFADDLFLSSGEHFAVGERRRDLTLFGSEAWVIAPWEEAPMIATNSEDITNRVAVARAGGSSLSQSDLASIALHGEVSTQRTDLLFEDDGMLDDWATIFLDVNAGRSMKIGALLLDAAMDPAIADVIPVLDHGLFTAVLREWLRRPGTLPKIWFQLIVLGYSVSIAALGTGHVEWHASLDVTVPTSFEMFIS